MKTLKRDAGQKDPGRSAPPATPTPTAMAAASNLSAALADGLHVSAVADELTRAADALHKRLAAELKKGTIEQLDAQNLFEDEALLRERANSLALDAADYVLRDLPLTQEKLNAAIIKARARIEKFEDLTVILDLAADLTLMAGALLSGKASPFLTALKKLKADGASLDKL